MKDILLTILPSIFMLIPIIIGIDLYLLLRTYLKLRIKKLKEDQQQI